MWKSLVLLLFKLGRWTAGEHRIDRTLKASFLSSPLHPSLSHPSPPIVWPLLPPVLISAPIVSYESPPPNPKPQKLEEVTNLQERVEAIGEGVSISQHHGVENRDMGMREGFGDSRGLWDGDSGWRGGRWG